MSYPFNSAFSTKLKTLQLAWDSTSLGALKCCPRKYQLSIMLGWRPRAESIHLTFGILLHSGIERYHHRRAEGSSHQEALRDALRQAMISTWDRELGRPSLVGTPQKNRFTLIRTLVWYLDKFQDDVVKTVILANGKPAVELSFRFEFGPVANPTGEPYLLCGHLDRLGSLDGTTFICDSKTTGHTIDDKYWAQWSPNNQLSTYAFAGRVFYQTPVLGGIIIDAAQVAVTFSRFERQIVPRTDDQLAEWFEDTQAWLRQAETFAETDHWPMNELSCGAYGGCEFREVCSKSPKVREQWLEATFKRRVWDPLVVRGDI